MIGLLTTGGPRTTVVGKLWFKRFLRVLRIQIEYFINKILVARLNNTVYETVLINYCVIVEKPYFLFLTKKVTDFNVNFYLHFFFFFSLKRFFLLLCTISFIPNTFTINTHSILNTVPT